MGEVVVGSGEIDCWREIVPVQHEDRQLTVQVLFRTLKYSVSSKEYHVKLTSEEDDCFLYRTVITPEEHRRLMLSHSMNISFDQLPEYFRQLLKAVRQEGEGGERYFINVLAQSTPGLAARIELLITMRQAGYVVQNKRLCLPFTLASDADFKEHLIGCFDKIKKDKEQLRRSVNVLETQLRDERRRSQELEDKNRWLQKELEFSQGLLRSAEKIQKHYESLLNQKHRGEIGGSVLVKIEDSLVSGENQTGVISNASTRHCSDPLPLSTRSRLTELASKPFRQSTDECRFGENEDDSDTKRIRGLSTVEEDNVTLALAGGNTGSSRISQSVTDVDNAGVSSTSQHSSPVSTVINTVTTTTTSTVSAPVNDKKTPLKGAAKRKASFQNFTCNQNGTNGVSSTAPPAPSAPSSTSTTTTSTSSGTAGCAEEETAKPAQQTQQRPPPRKYAAAMVQVNSQLMQIRREQEEQRRKTVDEEATEDDVKRELVVDTGPVEHASSSGPKPQDGGHCMLPINATTRNDEQSSTEVSAPARPVSHPTVLVSPPSAPHPSPFATPAPPNMPTTPTAPSSDHLTPTFQPSWHMMSTSPSLPMVTSLQFPVAAAAAAAFGGHRDLVGLGMSPYLLPAINSVTGGIMASMTSAGSSSSTLDARKVSFEEYNAAANYGRSMAQSTEMINDRRKGEMSWPVMPKSEPNDCQDGQAVDVSTRGAGSIVSGTSRNGANSAVNLMMTRSPHLMSALTVNENSLGAAGDSPAPNGIISSPYSASASPSLSTSSAEAAEGIVSYLKCLICERSFGQEGAAVHMAQHVTDPQRCPICSEMPAFPSKDELIKHMVGHCSRAYACRYCGKENPRVHYLKIHVRSHTGEKPYTCLQCGRGFADASTWRRHERVHTGEKPYECTICGRRIARRDNVKIHMRSHMRNKVQMSCRTCGKAFSQPNHLVLHERMCGSAAGGGGGGDLKPCSTSASMDGVPIAD